MRFRYSINPVALLFVEALMILQAPGAHAQVPEMTATQARQALLPYVQAPDTTLGTKAVSDTDTMTGHTIYLFYGDSGGGFGGGYRIDAATGTKTIQYVRHSTWDHDPSDTPTPLSTAQLIQDAQGFAAAHFPAYASSRMYNQNGGHPPWPVQDADGYFATFAEVASSGAEQPIGCTMNVEEDTGWIQSYSEEDIPVTISTTPAITQDQAVTIGQQWIQQNESTDPAQYALEASSNIGGDPSVEFKVNVDAVLNQTLIYEVKYVITCLFIDAQSGTVMGEDGWAGGIGSGDANHPPRRNPSDREDLIRVGLGKTADIHLTHCAIRVHNQTYLWAGYLKSLGVSMRRQERRLELEKAGKRFRLSIGKASRASGRVAWDRRKTLYVPLSLIQKLCPQVKENPATAAVDLDIAPKAAR